MTYTLQDKKEISKKLKEKAINEGFTISGIASIPGSSRLKLRTRALERWLSNNHHGEMKWMEAERRKNIGSLLENAKSVLCVGFTYISSNNSSNNFFRVGKFSQGEDYHKVFKGKLKRFASKLFPILDKDKLLDLKVFVDTAPLLEKPLAQLAGLGWQGKHTNLVSKEFGSWLFLGVILLNKDIPVDLPENDHCGSCKACLDICPTEAFIAPYEIDPRKCISYLTIEYSGKISEMFMEKMGNRIYGCDDCLAICPWNKFAKLSSEIKFHEIDKEFSLDILLTLDEFSFKKKFAKSPIKRIGRERFIRNCCIAAGNSKNKIYKKQLKYLLDNEKSEIILYAANWANERLV